MCWALCEVMGIERQQDATLPPSSPESGVTTQWETKAGAAGSQGLQHSEFHSDLGLQLMTVLTPIPIKQGNRNSAGGKKYGQGEEDEVEERKNDGRKEAAVFPERGTVWIAPQFHAAAHSQLARSNGEKGPCSLSALPWQVGS